MSLHPNGLAYGTLRRAPAPGFAHALLLDQGGAAKTWQVSDLYGSEGTLLTDEEVADWTIVYTPIEDSEWHARTVLLRNPPITPRERYPLMADNNYDFHISDIEVDRRAREEGHGWVRKRDDGRFAKCGGSTGACGVCRREAEIFGDARTQQPTEA